MLLCIACRMPLPVDMVATRNHISSLLYVQELDITVIDYSTAVAYTHAHNCTTRPAILYALRHYMYNSGSKEPLHVTTTTALSMAHCTLSFV